MFEPWLERWSLVADGAPIVTRNSRLVPVRRGGEAAMLKIALEPEEVRGNALLAWWSGSGGAPVLAQQAEALLMLRAEADRSLADLAAAGGDERAARVLCAVAARLHGRGADPPPGLTPLAAWFAPLTDYPARHSVLLDAAAVAVKLLADQADKVALHGDIHHRNVLRFGGEWLAIDPKGLFGERAFDYVNILRNPDEQVAASRERLARVAALVAAEARLERGRLLQWLAASSALSASWHMADGVDASFDLKMTELALACEGN